MTDKYINGDQQGIDLAINQVLEAETAAQQRISDAAKDAETRLVEAHHLARHIARRTDKRVTQIHLRFQAACQSLEKQQQAIHKQAAGLSLQQSLKPQLINRISEKLADELTHQYQADQK